MRKISLTIFVLVLSTLWSAAVLDAQTPRATNRQIQTLLDRIETKTDTFRMEVENRLSENRRTNRNIDDSVTRYIADFETATDSLKSDFVGRRANAAQVNDVLNRARNIDDFMSRNRLGTSAETQWRLLRADLDTLAGYYTVNWNWNRPNNGGIGNNDRPGRWGDPIRRRGFGLDSRLTGTYTLNTARSDDINNILDRELSSFSTTDRDRFRRMLERRLGSPEQLAIEKRGRTFTVASNLAEPVTVQTDNIAKTETTPRGRTIRTKASATTAGVTISTEGDRANDFWLSFEPEGSDRLRVTRRLYLENQGRTISSTSVYDKTSSVAQWPTVDRRPDFNNTGRTDFHIPNGVRLTAVLQNRISTRASQIGDRFTMEVTSPSQYRGAIIEGRLAEVESSGRVSGRANIALEFDTLRMNGREYAFAGIIDSARAANGENVNLSNEGSVRDSSQTKKTVTRAGIGAVLGALIGAVAGGGGGAAVGAGVGAGAGAGSVLIQGRDNLNLEQGSTFNITATAPQNVGRNFRP
jgi:hypothetical protein